MRRGAAVSATGHNGQSEAIHSPEECARTVVSLISLNIDRGRLDCGDLMLAQQRMRSLGLKEFRRPTQCANL